MVMQREKQASHLELEQFLELLLDLLGVGAAAPVAWQPVRVGNNFQQRQLRLKSHAGLCYECSAHCQNYAKRGCPPAHTMHPDLLRIIARFANTTGIGDPLHGSNNTQADFEHICGC